MLKRFIAAGLALLSFSASLNNVNAKEFDKEIFEKPHKNSIYDNVKNTLINAFVKGAKKFKKLPTLGKIGSGLLISGGVLLLGKKISDRIEMKNLFHDSLEQWKKSKKIQNFGKINHPIEIFFDNNYSENISENRLFDIFQKNNFNQKLLMSFITIIKYKMIEYQHKKDAVIKTEKMYKSYKDKNKAKGELEILKEEKKKKENAIVIQKNLKVHKDREQFKNLKEEEKVCLEEEKKKKKDSVKIIENAWEKYEKNRRQKTLYANVEKSKNNGIPTVNRDKKKNIIYGGRTIEVYSDNIDLIDKIGGWDIQRYGVFYCDANVTDIDLELLKNSQEIHFINTNHDRKFLTVHGNVYSDSLKKIKISVPDKSSVRVDVKFLICPNLEEIELPLRFTEKNMFKNCTNLKVLLLPYANRIDDFSCDNLNKLKTVDLKNAVSIGNGAFRNTPIQEINLKNVEFIDDNAFFDCKELTKVKTTKVEKIGDMAFSRCKKLKIFEYNENNIKFVDEMAFYESGYNGDLSKYRLNELHKDVNTNLVKKSNKIYNSENLNKTKEPSYKIIGSTFVIYSLPENVLNGEFINKKSNESDVKIKSLIYVGKYQKVKLKSGFPKTLEKIYIEKCTVKKIPNEMFKNYNNLTEVKISVTEKIGKNAFESCKNLKFAYFENVSEIGNAAFNNCENLELIYCPKVQIIQERAFCDCKKIKNLYLPEVKQTFNLCFLNCQNLVSLHLGKVTSVSNDIISGCTNLKVLFLPKVTDITSAFFNPCKDTLEELNLEGINDKIYNNIILDLKNLKKLKLKNYIRDFCIQATYFNENFLNNIFTEEKLLNTKFTDKIENGVRTIRVSKLGQLSLFHGKNKKDEHHNIIYFDKNGNIDHDLTLAYGLVSSSGNEIKKTIDLPDKLIEELRKIKSGEHEISPADVKQNKVGDCWLLGGIMMLSSTEAGRNSLKECLNLEENTKEGVKELVIKLHNVKMVDYIECSKNYFIPQERVNIVIPLSDIAYNTASNSKLWVNLLENAFSILRYSEKKNTNFLIKSIDKYKSKSKKLSEKIKELEEKQNLSNDDDSELDRLRNKIVKEETKIKRFENELDIQQKIKTLSDKKSELTLLQSQIEKLMEKPDFSRENLNNLKNLESQLADKKLEIYGLENYLEKRQNVNYYSITGGCAGYAAAVITGKIFEIKFIEKIHLKKRNPIIDEIQKKLDSSNFSMCIGASNAVYSLSDGKKFYDYHYYQLSQIKTDTDGKKIVILRNPHNGCDTLEISGEDYEEKIMSKNGQYIYESKINLSSNEVLVFDNSEKNIDFSKIDNNIKILIVFDYNNITGYIPETVESLDMRKCLDIDKKSKYENFLKNCKNLKTLDLFIDCIDENLVKNLINLEELYLYKSDNINTEIGKNAFANSTKLKNLTISGVKKIGQGAFKNCVNLKKLIVNKSLTEEQIFAAFPDNVAQKIVEKIKKSTSTKKSVIVKV